MSPQVDLIINFRASSKTSLSKQQIRSDAQKAEQQYSRLIHTLSNVGIHAVGRRGESLGHLLVFVSCPTSLISDLFKREQHSDLLFGLSANPLVTDGDTEPLSPAHRIRLIYAYISSTPADGGLGISPGSADWNMVESIMTLHDREFNEAWIHFWTRHKIFSAEGLRIREQFGEAVAMYFSFLSAYTGALVFPAILGILFSVFGAPYSPTYSILLLLWSVVFVEWWRVRERVLSVRFHSRGSFRVEKRRAEYIPGFSWWRRELRMIASLPIILMFAGVLTTLLTGIFVFEAFVTKLYTGPGHRYIAFSPTLLFVVLVPRFLALYQSLAKRFTAWENHAHQSSHNTSLTLKTFALSALVAHSGIALSAFIYLPFGEGLMRVVQVWLFSTENLGGSAGNTTMNTTLVDATAQSTNVTANTGVWDLDANVGEKLNHGRLRDEMFAYTVTNQVINTFVEVGLPFVLRALGSLRNGNKSNGLPPTSPTSKKKRVVFEDEQEKGGKEEREFLQRVRREAALPAYELFEDYDEMVTQFGYVALWSTIWPLAPVMALLNNILELRSDAYKITVHYRRPIPCRTDTIGPWLDALSFLTWLSALTNTALVYLFCPSFSGHGGSPLDKVRQQLFSPADTVRGDKSAARELLMTAVLIALAASHGYMVLRVVVRHLVERLAWKSNPEVKEREEEERELRETFLKGLVAANPTHVNKTGEGPQADEDQKGGEGEDAFGVSFWEHDEGLEDIQRISKEA